MADFVFFLTKGFVTGFKWISCANWIQNPMHQSFYTTLI